MTERFATTVMTQAITVVGVMPVNREQPIGKVTWF